MQSDVIGGRYRRGPAIGQGGMGTVWLCRDETLRRDVAVKQVGLLPGESVTDSARALREARSSAALSHRNVVTVFDVVEENGAIWLVMEHVPSRSLSDIIKQEGALDPAVVADIGAQVAAGLAAAHAAGTMHRDVKPGNVLIRDDGVAKISDFGIARSAGDPALTQSGFLTGTPSYFSPELARGAAPAPASDVWALGATLYAAVEGRPPYPKHENPVAVLHDIATQQPPPTRAGFLEPVLLRMLDRDPGSRWSMEDAAHSLRRLADQHAPENTRSNTLGLGPATLAHPAPDPSPEPSPQPSPEPSPTADSDRSPRTTGGGGRPARPAPRPERTGRERSRRGAYATVALVALLLVAGGIAWAVGQSGSGGSATGAGTSAGSRSPSHRPSGSASPKQSPSPSRRSSTGTPSPSTSAASTGHGLPAQRAFLSDYFAKAPGGTDAAWAMLGPQEQAKAGGRSSFNGFWRTIRSVDVSNVTPAGSNAVQATLTYHKIDGGVSTERHLLDLTRSGSGGYLINNDGPAG